MGVRARTYLGETGYMMTRASPPEIRDWPTDRVSHGLGRSNVGPSSWPTLD